MTARTRTRPRPLRAAKPRPKRRPIRPPFKWDRFVTPEYVALAILAGVAVLLALTIDVPATLADGRDTVLRTSGVGSFILAALVAPAALLFRNPANRNSPLFLRKAAGAATLGLFAWGALALNEADWAVGSVSFRDVSLGGSLGQWLVGGLFGKLAWLGLGVIAAWLLAPTLTLAFFVNAPQWIKAAWTRRWPHRFFAAIGRAFILPFRLGGDDSDAPDYVPEFIIGGPHGQRLQPAGGAAALEDGPRIFRPSSEPGAPGSRLGAGAAAMFGGSAAVMPAAPPAAEAEPPPKSTVALPEPDSEEEQPGENTQLGLALEPKSAWHLPALDLLNAPNISTSRKHDNAARAQLIVDTLASFGVDAAVVEINEGPTVTQFGVEPGWEVRYKDVQLRDENGKALLGPDGRPRVERVETGRTRVRVNRITALQNDLALAVAAPTLRIEAPVPGRAIVGIEIPNDSATVVTLRHVMETPEFNDLAKKSKLAIALGKGVSGVPVVADLARMPHLLIAGATGSGKSVCMNAIIGGIMMNATPEQVRFVMIDPKRVELTPYSHIPHLAFSEVIVDMDKVVGVLQAVIAEMEARYKKFAEVAVRNVESYNKHPRVLKKLPYWVVIIDELADLMMVAPFEVEKLLCRLAQLARATGIHLVVATQRPSVDVVTGLIKANFPTRIAFAVTSMTDSRTILDMGGAEKLLGRGDMLYMPTDAAKPIRIQGVYVSDVEVERLVQFWTDDRFRDLAPEHADELLAQALIAQNGGDDIDLDEDEPVVGKARELAMQHQRVSPSLLQRRLKIGSLKATKIIEMLADEGTVGPREEGESRRVLVHSDGSSRASTSLPSDW